MPRHIHGRVLWFLSATLALSWPAAAASSVENGKQLYARFCFMCHQSIGQGAPPNYPPLDGSDFLAKDKERSIRILITGLSDSIAVKGAVYKGVMPAAPLDDQQLADVLSFVDTSWGNSNGLVDVGLVKQVRSKIPASGKGSVADPNPYPPLPKPPAGFALREVVRLPNYPTRMAGDGQGKMVYVLCENADVWRVETKTGGVRRILAGEDYAEPDRGHLNSVGLTLDAQRRLYIVVNRQHQGTPFVSNEVTIYRTVAMQGEDPASPRPWFATNYPWGISAYNHGVGNIATGPDGWIYVNSGSRTDGNEAGTDPHFFPGGEVFLTACMWRLDPRADPPRFEIFARGLRNNFGFCWNDRGEMFATENGPDANAPEELNLLEQGRHYGFPYRFSNWTNKPYAYTPDAPAGLEFTLPIANLGPDGGFAGQPLYTFDPHSSPGGVVFLDEDFPPGVRGSFLLTRFGNLIQCAKDVGFDLLQVRLKKNGQGIYEAQVNTLLSPLARPVDILHSGPGQLIIAEYSRVLNNSGAVAMLPGRLLELSVKNP